MDKDQIKVVEKFIKRLIKAVPDFTEMEDYSSDSFSSIYKEVHFNVFPVGDSIFLYLDRNIKIEGVDQKILEELFEAFQQRKEELNQQREIKREKELISRLEVLVTKLDKGE